MWFNVGTPQREMQRARLMPRMLHHLQGVRNTDPENNTCCFEALENYQHTPEEHKLYDS